MHCKNSIAFKINNYHNNHDSVPTYYNNSSIIKNKIGESGNVCNEVD